MWMGFRFVCCSAVVGRTDGRLRVYGSYARVRAMPAQHCTIATYSDSKRDVHLKGKFEGFG